MKVNLCDVLVGVLIAFGATGRAVASDATATASRDVPIAERPFWAVGDSWIYRATNGAYTYEERFAEETTFEGQPALVVITRYRTYYTKNYGFIARERDGKVVRRITPPTDWQWPLRVGGTWYWSGTWEDTERTLQRYTYRDSWTVQSYEDVTVLAGTFKAFKLRRQVEGSDAYDEVWYSSQVKRAVKRRGSSAAGTHDEELVSYKVQ